MLPPPLMNTPFIRNDRVASDSRQCVIARSMKPTVRPPFSIDTRTM